MTARRLVAFSAAVALLAMNVGSPAAAGPAAAAYFVPKATWQETLLASREAIGAAENETEKQAAAQKAADPVLREFQPVLDQITGKDEPRKVRIRLAGVKRIYLGAGVSNELIFGNPRWFDREGQTVPPPPLRVQMNRGVVRHDGYREWQPITVGKQVFETGFLLRDAEVWFEPGQRIQGLELTVATRGSRVPTPFWIDLRSHAQQESAMAASRENVWRLTAERFPDRDCEFQRRLEESQGIWKQDWKPGDFVELATRYATACHGEFRKAALEAAQTVRTPADLQRVREIFYLEHARQRLELARRTLEFVELAARRPQFAAALQALEKQVADARPAADAHGMALYTQVAELRRQIILSHPLLNFDRLLIDKRSGRLPEHMCDQYLGRHSQQAPGLVILDSWKDHPRETVLLEGKLPPGGTIHPDLSFDGQRVLFAFADHSTARTGPLRGYFIYELSLATGQVRQVTGTAKDPMLGQLGRETVLIEDMNPCYLPDGGFAFISTRSQQFGRCHGGRYVPSYTLYRGELDGSNLRPLSFNESNEWGPSVMHDGLLLYTRWDYINRHDTRFQSLWVMRPDGTTTAHYYGNNSSSPCLIGEARAIPGSHKAVATAAAHHGQTLGTLIIVDPRKGQDHGQPLTWITPELAFPESGVPEGITLTARPLEEDVGRVGGDSRRSARAGTPFPLSEDLFLAAYPNGEELGIYLIDTLGGRELIHADPNVSCFNPIPLRPTPRPPIIASAIAGLEQETSGQFFIQDVYQCSHPLDHGSIKSLRVNEIISQPTSSVPPRSWASNEIVKRVLGTVPVDADGSTAFEAPANRPLQLQLLDGNGMAVMTMRSVVYLQPGERATCVGCHEPRSDSPVAAARLKRVAVHRIEPPAGPRYDGGLSFVRTVQPVLDRYCIGCHGLNQTAGDVDLLGTMEQFDGPGKKKGKGKSHPMDFTQSYYTLVSRNGMVKIAPRNGETYPSRPKDYFAHAGRLAQFLLDGHPDRQGHKLVEIDRESFHRIVDWLDLNGQFYGDYSFNRIENQPPRAEGEQALRQAIARRFGPELADQPYAALVNVALPAESRILKAPLAQPSGGWGQIVRGGWTSTADPSYREMARLVEDSITPLAYHDIAGTCGHDNSCRCGVCWVRKDIEARTKSKSATPVAAVERGK
jgi:hypothetical protein